MVIMLKSSQISNLKISFLFYYKIHRIFYIFRYFCYISTIQILLIQIKKRPFNLVLVFLLNQLD